MRADRLNDGTLKALLILILIVANIALSLLPSRTLGSARASRAVFGALAENFSSPGSVHPDALAETPRAAREARAIPAPLPH